MHASGDLQKSASSGSYGQAEAASSPIGFAGSDGIQSAANTNSMGLMSS
eukprot:CAMPEP_0180178040 /NCGR_PEP_ID=MMETSP0986-20121125/38184_1 /TAXON_ID=697907 /ORGANISM="non described non described, Strain CCMP2293" /LENGTH=48 /DNA_ID= /DNA_START= /DNA_END= /DNA_ORIENTATION=